VDIKILSRIDISDLTIFDFCKILGILLDNAVEAAEKCERKYVRLHMNESDGCVLKVEISNTFSGSVNTEKIYEKGVSSKENPSGYGLWEAKRILSDIRIAN
jgi:two-component system sensor histidine kinase AgrC